MAPPRSRSSAPFPTKADSLTVAAAESPEFPGLVIDALYRDAALMSRSGKVFYAAELAEEYGLVDIDGKLPPSPRAMLGKPPKFNDAIVE